MSQHKDEALKAIAHVRAKLDEKEGIPGLEHRLLLATLDHALANVEAIVEVKRVRRPRVKDPLWEEKA